MNKCLLAVLPVIIWAGCENFAERPVHPAKESHTPTQFSVAIDSGAETVEGAVITRDFFAGGVRPLLGRFLVDEEFGTRATAVAVMSHRYWVERFKSDPTIIGRQIRVNGQPTTIVGIAPAQFQPDPPSLLWIPKVR